MCKFIVSHFEQILKAVEFLIAGTKCGFDKEGCKNACISKIVLQSTLHENSEIEVYLNCTETP
jgi:hypothetical protein